MSDIQNLLKIKNNILSKNDELSKMDETLNNNFQIDLDKHTFIDRIEGNIEELSKMGVILQFKYDDLKYYYDFFNIFIIIISAILTIIEALKNEIDYENRSEPIKYLFKLAPIFISTIITLIGTILKFKKYQADLETLTKILEKAILTVFRMKKLQEQLHFANGIKIDTITEMYLDEIFILYNQSEAEMTKFISYKEKIYYKGKLKKCKLKELNNEFISSSTTNNQISYVDKFLDKHSSNNGSHKSNVYPNHKVDDTLSYPSGPSFDTLRPRAHSKNGEYDYKQFKQDFDYNTKQDAYSIDKNSMVNFKNIDSHSLNSNPTSNSTVSPSTQPLHVQYNINEINSDNGDNNRDNGDNNGIIQTTDL